MPVRPIVLLGDPQLYQPSSPVQRERRPELPGTIADLHDTVRALQAEHGWGRAISAPQIGMHVRIVCLNDHVRPPLTFIKPRARSVQQRVR